MNLLSSQYDIFEQQIKDLISSAAYLKNENIRIMEENTRFKNELKSMSNRINILEQKASEYHMKIICVSEVKMKFIITL